MKHEFKIVMEFEDDQSKPLHSGPAELTLVCQLPEGYYVHWIGERYDRCFRADSIEERLEAVKVFTEEWAHLVPPSLEVTVFSDPEDLRRVLQDINKAAK